MVVDDPGEGCSAHGSGIFALRRMIREMVLALIGKPEYRVSGEIVGLRHDRRAVAVAMVEIERMADAGTAHPTDSV